MIPQEVFDSEDPHLPNLPTADQVVWSDYDFSGDEDDSVPQKDESDDSEHNYIQRNVSNKKERSRRSSRLSRKGSIFNGLFGFNDQRKLSNNNSNRSDLESQKYVVHDDTDTIVSDDDDDVAVQFADADRVEEETSLNGIPTYELNQPITPILNSSSEITEEKKPHSSTKRRKNRRRHRKSKARRYAGSKSKKERVGWEPGINIETTNVVLRTPGSRITITDYSESRYRVTRYNLYSEMNPRFNKFTTDYDHQKKLIPYGMFDDNESIETRDTHHDEEFEIFLNYMDKVAKSKEEVEAAIQNKPAWSKVRWISVVGLSWEATLLLAKKYDLHALAIEDMIDIPQRTKTDVYKSHLFVVLPLIKLIKTKMKLPKESFYKKACRKLDFKDDLFTPDEVTVQVTNTAKPKTIATKTALADELDQTRESIKGGNNKRRDSNSDDFINSINAAATFRSLTDLSYVNSLNSKAKKRLKMIQKHRPLTSKSLVVGTEQLSMFLTKDNTVLTFFEHNAPEIENAILSRLSTDNTILRESCDPSILFHSVLDVTSDLLYPVLEAYVRIINEKELEILTSYVPDVKHTQGLHLMINELAVLKSTIAPVASLLTQLRLQCDDANFPFLNDNVKLYLSDISDHLLSFIDEIDGMTSTIENLINLVFNTISVATNNSMQQLSIVTVLFLPLTFWAGYFGMNFELFGELKSSVSLYWKIAAPFTAGMMLLLMYKSVWRFAIWGRNLINRLYKKASNSFASGNKGLKLKERLMEAKTERAHWSRLSQLRQRKKVVSSSY